MHPKRYHRDEDLDLRRTNVDAFDDNERAVRGRDRKSHWSTRRNRWNREKADQGDPTYSDTDKAVVVVQGERDQWDPP